MEKFRWMQFVFLCRIIKKEEKKMNVWLMNLKDNRKNSQSKAGDEKFQFCMSQGIVGIGWVGYDPETSDDSAFLRAHLFLNSFEVGDLVWVHNNVTDQYYICNITEKAKKSNEESFEQNDIGEYCRCKFIDVGNAQTLPNGITAERLISITAISPASEDIAVITKQHFSFLTAGNKETGKIKKNFSKTKERLLKFRIFKKPKLLIAMVAVIAALGVATGIIIRNRNYYKNMSSSLTSMELRNDYAEKAGYMLGKVWYNTIFKESDPDTDYYTKSESYGRYFNSDFNDSIKAFCGLKKGIEADENYSFCAMCVDSDYPITRLKNPPIKYKEAYNAMYQYYNSVQSLVELVADSGGHSYESYEDAYREKVEKAKTDYKAVKKYFE